MLLACPLFCIAALVGVSQTKPVTLHPEADTMYQSGKWKEAAAAYEEITRNEPDNGQAWFRLGTSLHSVGDYRGALVAFQHGEAINHNPLVMFSLAESFARLGEKNNAFEWLERSAQAGFAQIARLKGDADLSEMRSDPRFAELLKTVDRTIHPCMYAPEYRQFDFWIGEWDVFVQGKHVGANNVQQLVDGCIVFENWSSDGGTNGKSLNFYDSQRGLWQQTWMGSGGGALNLHGEYKDNAMRFTGETPGPNGTKTLEKLTFFNIDPHRLRQFWEQSTDDGKTWTAVWDSIYVRKKQPAAP